MSAASSRAEKAKAKIQAEVDAWNAKYPVGTVVRYWKSTRDEAPTGEGATRFAATMLGDHTAVAWISGCTGCVALSHVEAVAS